MLNGHFLKCKENVNETKYVDDDTPAHSSSQERREEDERRMRGGQNSMGIQGPARRKDKCRCFRGGQWTMDDIQSKHIFHSVS